MLAIWQGARYIPDRTDSRLHTRFHSWTPYTAEYSKYLPSVWLHRVWGRLGNRRARDPPHWVSLSSFHKLPRFWNVHLPFEPNLRRRSGLLSLLVLLPCIRSLQSILEVVATRSTWVLSFWSSSRNHLHPHLMFHFGHREAYPHLRTHPCSSAKWRSWLSLKVILFDHWRPSYR